MPTYHKPLPPIGLVDFAFDPRGYAMQTDSTFQEQQSGNQQPSDLNVQLQKYK
jgi:hypothetical protein